MKLKFIGDAFYNGELVHRKGDVVDLDNANGYAMRWVSRLLAVEVLEEEVKPQPIAEVEVKTEVVEELVILEVEKLEAEVIIEEKLEVEPLMVQKRRTRK